MSDIVSDSISIDPTSVSSRMGDLNDAVDFANRMTSVRPARIKPIELYALGPSLSPPVVLTIAGLLLTPVSRRVPGALLLSIAGLT
jgi:hypothetical protein